MDGKYLRPFERAVAEVDADKVAALVSVVTDTVDSPHSKRAYGRAIRDFLAWYREAGQIGMSRAVVADSRLEGSTACEFTAMTSASNGTEAGVFHEYDISGDPVGTHYILEFGALTENLQGSSIRTKLIVYDAVSAPVRTDYFDTYEHANSETMLSAGSRKRDSNHHTLRFHIYLYRDNASAVTASERVLIDNLRLLKMQP